MLRGLSGLIELRSMAFGFACFLATPSLQSAALAASSALIFFGVTKWMENTNDFLNGFGATDFFRIRRTSFLFKKLDDKSREVKTAVHKLIPETRLKIVREKFASSPKLRALQPVNVFLAEPSSSAAKMPTALKSYYMVRGPCIIFLYERPEKSTYFKFLLYHEIAHCALAGGTFGTAGIAGQVIECFIITILAFIIGLKTGIVIVIGIWTFIRLWGFVFPVSRYAIECSADAMALEAIYEGNRSSEELMEISKAMSTAAEAAMSATGPSLKEKQIARQHRHRAVFLSRNIERIQSGLKPYIPEVHPADYLLIVVCMLIVFSRCSPPWGDVVFASIVGAFFLVSAHYSGKTAEFFTLVLSREVQQTYGKTSISQCDSSSVDLDLIRPLVRGGIRDIMANFREYIEQAKELKMEDEN